jgi:transposase-like protein
MTIAEREQQILRIKTASFQSELNEQLEVHLRKQVIETVKTTIEAALVEEAKADRTKMLPQPRRSGYYGRRLNTRYGRIERLSVPKLRHSNKARNWTILERHHSHWGHLLDFAGYLYVMGLSLRDLQEALYFLLDDVLSRTAINQITLKMQARMQQHQQRPLEQTPPILIVDGVWVDIQYTLDEIKIDQAGHHRQVRQAQERVILVAMAVWPDGSYHIFHYEVAETEAEQTWLAFFEHLIERGLKADQVELLVSDGTKGLLGAMKQCLPNARQQRCITHKVRGLKPYLTYQDLPQTSDTGQPLSETEAKQHRWQALKQDAYAIYEAASYDQAQAQLHAFVDKWQPLEPKAVHAFQWGIRHTFTFYDFGKELHRHIRTTNHLERFFREFRAKADEIGAFPNEDSCLTIFYWIMLRDHAKHDRLSVAKNL